MIVKMLLRNKEVGASRFHTLMAIPNFSFPFTSFCLRWANKCESESTFLYIPQWNGTTLKIYQSLIFHLSSYILVTTDADGKIHWYFTSFICATQIFYNIKCAKLNTAYTWNLRTASLQAIENRYMNKYQWNSNNQSHNI